MLAVIIHRLVECKAVHTRFGARYVAEVEIVGQPKSMFWLSIKQGEQLVRCACRLRDGYSTKHCELHAVLDDAGRSLRWVWCGTHSAESSDLSFLHQAFGVTCVPVYAEVLDASERDAHPALKDAP